MKKQKQDTQGKEEEEEVEIIFHYLYSICFLFIFFLPVILCVSFLFSTELKFIFEITTDEKIVFYYFLYTKNVSVCFVHQYVMPHFILSIRICLYRLLETERKKYLLLTINTNDSNEFLAKIFKPEKYDSSLYNST